MVFDFDTFINKACVGETDIEGNVKEGIFGRNILYIPADNGFESFPIAGDFHKSYEEVQPDTMSESSITSEQIVVFIRKIDMPEFFPKPLQGDYVEVDGFRFQVIDVQIHIPGSLKLVLHEEV